MAKSSAARAGRHKHGEGYAIDFYAYTSQMRDWSPDFKAGFAVLVMILSIVLDNPYVSVTVILAMAYLTIAKGGMSAHGYLSVMTVPITFILLGTFAIAIDFSREAAGQYHLYLGVGYIYTSLAGLRKMLFLILKVYAAISALQMLTLSTPASEIISVLRRAHVPKLIIELMNLIYRFIFILLDVHVQMKNAAKARQGYCDFKTSCLTFGHIASNMLVVSLKKANAYYDAMEARGYDGELFFLEAEKPTVKRQLIAAALFIVGLILLWQFTK